MAASRLLAAAVVAALPAASLPARADVPEERAFPIVDRDAAGKLVDRETVLPNLAGNGKFMSRSFILVIADGDKPIPLDTPDPALAKRAATVYYHLEKAKRDFETRAQLVPALAKLGRGVRYPVVIRLEMTLPWSDASHFQTNGGEEYNTSLAVEASKPDLKGPGVAPWGQEIWFYRAKESSRPSTANQVADLMNQRAFKNVMFEQLSYPEMVQIGQEVAVGARPFWPAHAAAIGSSLVATEALLPLLKLALSPFDTKYRIDPAMIPEVIYHEFSHLLFFERLGMFQPRAVVEGYPNFFAHQVSGVDDLNGRAGQYVKNVAVKKAFSREKYSPAVDETSLYAATGSFLYSLLVRLAEEFGDEADAIIYGALDDLDRSSDVRSDFTAAILSSIERNSARPLAQILGAKNVFCEKGFSGACKGRGRR